MHFPIRKVKGAKPLYFFFFMEKFKLIAELALVAVLLWIFRILYKSSKTSEEYMEELLKKTEKVKGQWDK